MEAGNAEQFDGNASVDQALVKLGLRSQYDLLPGMEVALMPHQTIGVAWMLEKEQSTLKGGCLGDDMGLGKVRSVSISGTNLNSLLYGLPDRTDVNINTQHCYTMLTFSQDCGPR